MPVSTSVMPWRTLALAAAEKERTVASKCADAGMMFSAVPAWKLPTVTTTGSKMSCARVTRVDNAVTISHAACDLTGVAISYPNRGGATVPHGGGTGIGNSFGFELTVHPGSLDVTITVTGPAGNA